MFTRLLTTLSFLIYPLILHSADIHAAVEKVPVWGIFETSFQNDRSYGDPYRDVSLDVIYTGPEGDSVRFWGFYDGDGTWKARFMPDRTGEWMFRAVFSDGSPAGEGRFMAEPSSIPGLIGQDPVNPLWFGFRSGRHLLVRGFHAGDRFFASNWPGENRQEFLDWAEGQGYNLLSVASFMVNRNVEGRGKGWNTPDLWDGTGNRPVPLAYGQAEVILDDLSRREILVYPFAGFFGQSSDFPLDPSDQELFLRYTIARWGPYWNLLFNVAGPEPLWRPGAYRSRMGLGEIIRLAGLIKELDPFGHPLSVHNETGPDPFRHEPWSDFITLQGGKGDPGNEVYRYIEKNAGLNKPIFAQEVFWPGNMYHGCRCDDPETIRKKAFILLFAGAAINFADMDGNSSSGFSGSLDPDDRHQEWHDAVKGAWDWMESIPFYRMKPQRSLGMNGYVLAEEGARYAVYIPDGRERVEVDLTHARGRYSLRWYDPVLQRYEGEVSRVEAGRTIETGPPPGDPSHDWIVLFERVD